MGGKKEDKAKEGKEKEVAGKPEDGKAGEESKVEEKKEVLTPAQVLLSSVGLIEQAVRHKDTRFLIGRVLRQTAGVRKALDAALLTECATAVLPAESSARQVVADALKSIEAGSMETDDGDADKAGAAPPFKDAKLTSVPEVEVFLLLVTIMRLLDHDKLPEALALTSRAVDFICEFDRRTMDHLAARVYFYYAYAHERCGQLRSIRARLLRLHQTATLRHDEIGQETLMNLVLRSYILDSLYDQAEKFRAKAQRPETSRSNQQLCRYLYYLGRIRAVQLEYSDAKDSLLQATRKAPSVALGFRIEATKWLTIVRLLLGELPERAELFHPTVRVPLAPYAALAQAVRRGDLRHFAQVTETHAEAFQADGVLRLIVRLRNNVIRAGLRRISLAYSRISLADVAARLGLDAGDDGDVEHIVAKAIRDGAVDGTIDASEGVLLSREVVDVYGTYEPQKAFDARIAFCLDLHNEAVRAMRFSDKSAAGKRSKIPTEEELAEALEDVVDEEF
ncbi:unnamed protein product [Pedinophyceae sp. YPF-701]|nr:unnamed protein product [Pedinophyceae sp. YPF-701]